MSADPIDPPATSPDTVPALGSQPGAVEDDPFKRALAEARDTQQSDAASRRARQRERTERIAAWWEDVAVRLPSGFSEQRFAEAVRTKPAVAATLARLRGWNPLSAEWRLICGPTGAGKTMGVVARLYAARRYLDGPDVDISHLPWIVWTREQDIVEAARKHKLGMGDPPLLEALRGRERIDRRGVPFCDDKAACDLAIIDEVGYCGEFEPLRRVLDVRYGSGKATVITTGLRLESDDPKEQTFVKLYGGALMRRLAEDKHVIDLPRPAADEAPAPEPRGPRLVKR